MGTRLCTVDGCEGTHQARGYPDEIREAMG